MPERSPLRSEFASEEDERPQFCDDASESSRRVVRSYAAYFRQRRYLLGLLLLLVVVVLWVASNFLTYSLFYDDSYSKPYLVTYINTSSFTLYLIPQGIRWLLRRRRQGRDRQGYEALAGEDEGTRSNEDGSTAKQAERIGFWQTLQLSTEFCVIWFMANYFAGFSFKYTSVASGTILSCTSSIWTLFLGRALGVERFTNRKFLAVMASFLGIAVVSMVDSNTPSSSGSESTLAKTVLQILLGDFTSLLGAVLYALYTTMLKYRVGDESRMNFQLFFGFVGAINILTLWPGFFILHFTGIERFQLPPNRNVWIVCGINALITLVSDFCWAIAMLLTTPLVATVGLGLTIPLALFGEIIMGQKVGGFLYLLGAAMVLGGFAFVNIEERRETTVEAEQREE